MNEEITASMTYDEKSMSPALPWHNHRQNRISLIVGSIALIMCVLSFWAAHSAPTDNGLVIKPVFAVAPAIAVVFVLVVRWLGPFLFARSIKSSPAHGSPLTFRISDDGVRATVAGGKAEYNWSHFLRSVVTPEGVLLYTQRVAFNWLPKSAFTSESDYTRFLGLVAAKTQHTKIG